MTAFRGTYTALVTPFTADGAVVDLDRLGRNIELQSIAGVQGVVPCGTTGETPTLSDEEYRTVVAHAVDAARACGLTTIVGAGANATARAVEQHRYAAEVGADAALHVTPYYNKPLPEGLYRHFMAIADAADLPIVLYNIPGRTGVNLTIATIERLAQHPNVAAIKEASGSVDHVSAIIRETGLTVLSGDDPLTLPLAVLGATGVISVLSNVLPDRVAAMCAAFAADAWSEARAINRELLPLARALLSLDTNPVPVKTALRILGRDTGAVRLPLCEPPASVVDELETLLKGARAETEVVTA